MSLPIKDRDAFYLLIVVIAGLATGYWLLIQAANLPDTPPWTAVIAIGIATIALLLGKSTAQTDGSGKTAVPDQTNALPSPFQKRLHFQPFSYQINPRRVGLFLLALLCLFYSLRTIPLLAATDNHVWVTLSWLVACSLGITAVLPWQKPSWPTLSLTKWQIAALGLLILLAFLLRVWRVSSIPYTLSGDEASQGLEAIDVLTGDLRNPLATGWLGVPTMSFFYNSLTIWLFGRTIFGLRFAWVFVGTLNVLTTFYLVKQLKGDKMAWLTAVLLALYHYHIHYARLGSNQIADPLFLSLALWFLYRSLDRNQRQDWALTGIICGLAFYFYAGARLTPVVVLAVLAYLFILKPRHFWQQHQAGLLVMLLSFLFVTAPMLQYATRFPNEFNARINQVGIIQSGWLEREIDLRGESMVAILWDQFQRAALAFTYYPDRTVWYGLKEPLLNPLFSTIFMCGLLFGTFRLIGKESGQRLAPMVAWWWGGMLLGGMLTESPPSSQRLITLSVPVCFFMALMLWELNELLHKAIRGLPRNGLLILGILGFGTYSLATYFLDYTPQRLYGGPHAELATQLAPTLNELKAEHHFYFVGAPWMYWSFSTLPYLVAEAEAFNVGEKPTTAPTTADFFAEGKGAVYIFLPERLDELAAVQAAFPLGHIEEVVSPINGRLMATLYQIDPP